jgi:hypothetical protein
LSGPAWNEVGGPATAVSVDGLEDALRQVLATAQPLNSVNSTKEAACVDFRAVGTALLLVSNGDRCYSSEAVRQSEEVVPMAMSTWVLLSGVTVGR